MEPISVTFLGTSSQVPTKNRNHTALLVRYKDEEMLFDCGEGTQRQFQYAHKNVNRITRIFITHWHGDHILGLPGLLQTLSLGNYQKTLQIYGPKGTAYWFDKLKPFCGTNLIKVQIHEVGEGVVVEGKEWQISAANVEHGVPALAYSFNIKAKRRLVPAKLKKLKLPHGPLLGKLQAGETIIHNGKKITAASVSYMEEGRKISIVLDTRYTERIVGFVQGSDLLITESSFLEDDLDKAGEYLHLTAGQAATLAKKSKSKKLALIHISQRYERTPQLVLKEAKKVFKNCVAPNDLDSIVLD